MLNSVLVNLLKNLRNSIMVLNIDYVLVGLVNFPIRWWVLIYMYIDMI
jgi:hypothetical protein